jgi:hypothetical protein
MCVEILLTARHWLGIEKLVLKAAGKDAVLKRLHLNKHSKNKITIK